MSDNENKNDNQPTVEELQTKIDTLQSQLSVPDEYKYDHIRDKDAATFDAALGADELKNTLAQLKEDGYTQREAERELKDIMAAHRAAAAEEAKKNATDDKKSEVDIEKGKKELETIMSRELGGQDKLKDALALYKDTLGRDFDPLVDKVQDLYKIVDNREKQNQLVGGRVNMVDPQTKELKLDIPDVYDESIRHKIELPPYDPNNEETMRKYATAVGMYSKLHREARIGDDSWNSINHLFTKFATAPESDQIRDALTGEMRPIRPRHGF